MLRSRPSARRRPFPRWLISAAAASAVFAAAAALEVGFRLFGPPTVLPYRDPESLKNLFDAARPCCRREGPRLVHDRIGLKSVSFPDGATRDESRIAVVGESSALALGQYMFFTMEKAVHTGGAQILACGVGGASLDMTEHRFREVLDYGPDAVVILFGHNLFNTHRWISPLRLKIGEVLSRSKLVCWLVADRFRLGPEAFSSAAERLARLEDFLRGAAAACRRRGVRLALCTVPGNLWMPPRIEPEDLEDEAFMEALFLHFTGLRSAALEALHARQAESPSAIGDFFLGAWLYEAGRFAEADDRLTAARDEDPARRRASTGVNRLIRAVAQDEGALLLDMERLLRGRAPGGIPGWESFDDDQHPQSHLETGAPVLSIEALEGLRRLSDEGLLRGVDMKKVAPLAMRPRPSGPGSFGVELRRLWEDDMMRAQSALAIPMSFWAARWADSFSGEMEAHIRALPNERHRAEMFCAFAEAMRRLGRRGAADRLNAEAVRLAPGWDLPRVQQGLFRLAEGRAAEAAEAFRGALAVFPGSPEAHFFLTRLERGRA